MIIEARKFVNKYSEVDFMYIYSADRHDRTAPLPTGNSRVWSPPVQPITINRSHSDELSIFRLKYENKIILTYNVFFFNENPEVFSKF